MYATKLYEEKARHYINRKGFLFRFDDGVSKSSLQHYSTQRFGRGKINAHKGIPIYFQKTAPAIRLKFASLLEYQKIIRGVQDAHPLSPYASAEAPVDLFVLEHGFSS
ncbi:hypothetical protein FXO37_23034 [Capsicum annuum]|nr:hypothetical protein FXO37_23034 [Capsicum annuum]